MRWLFSEVAEKFPGSQFKALGGFCFLRFFCPAIVAPKTFNLINEDLPVTVKRSFVLVAKLLQSLVNEAVFEKEPYMLPFNQFITSNVPRMHAAFLSSLSQKSPRTERQSPMNFSESDVNLSIFAVHQVLFENLSILQAHDISRELASLVPSQSSDDDEPETLGDTKMDLTPESNDRPQQRKRALSFDLPMSFIIRKGVQRSRSADFSNDPNDGKSSPPSDPPSSYSIPEEEGTINPPVLADQTVLVKLIRFDSSDDQMLLHGPPINWPYGWSKKNIPLKW